MANTKISALGSRKISVEGNDKTIAALGNGTAKPGDLVGITDSTLKVVDLLVGTSEMFVGILDDLPELAEDTAIPDGTPCRVIVPESGKKYNVKCTDPTGAVVSGLGHLSATAGGAAGAVVGAAATSINTAGVRWINTKALANGDTVGEFRYL